MGLPLYSAFHSMNSNIQEDKSHSISCGFVFISWTSATPKANILCYVTCGLISIISLVELFECFCQSFCRVLLLLLCVPDHVALARGCTQCYLNFINYVPSPIIRFDIFFCRSCRREVIMRQSRVHRDGKENIS